MEGEMCGFILPSSDVRNVANPAPALQFWDKIVKTYYNFVGLQYGRMAKQWGVDDKDISTVS